MMDWARPNELLLPGEREAVERIEAVYAAVDELSLADLGWATMEQLDPADRDERLLALEELADGLGRGDLLDDARDELRDTVLSRLSSHHGLVYLAGDLGSASSSAEGRAAIVAALMDLVAVAVVEDRLDPSDASTLARPGRQLLGTASRSDDASDDHGPLLPPPSPADLALTGAPSDADWAEAEHGSTAIQTGTRSLPDW